MLRISNISFSIQGKPLFEDASAVVPTGHKVGIVGRNGTGKTTLFKLIKKSLLLDSGTIETPSYFKIGGVEQEAPASNTSLIDTVLEADTERTQLLAEAETSEDSKMYGVTWFTVIKAWKLEPSEDYHLYKRYFNGCVNTDLRNIKELEKPLEKRKVS